MIIDRLDAAGWKLERKERGILVTADDGSGVLVTPEDASIAGVVLWEMCNAMMSEGCNVGRMLPKGCGDPECGCDEPSFTEPMEALRYLSGRMKYAGIGEGVALYYARDIDLILEKYTGRGSGGPMIPPSPPMNDTAVAALRRIDHNVRLHGQKYFELLWPDLKLVLPDIEKIAKGEM